MKIHGELALPALCGIPLKYISLFTVDPYPCRFADNPAHNTKLGVDTGLLSNGNLLIHQIMHYSRIMPVDKGRYFTSTAVFLSEVSKFLFCVAVVVVAFVKRHGKEGTPWSWRCLWSEMFGGDAWKLSIPAALYTVSCVRYAAHLFPASK